MEIRKQIEKILLLKYPDNPKCRHDTAVATQKRKWALNKILMDFEVSTDYLRVQTDCRLCSGCNEMILTDMFKLKLDVFGTQIVSENVVYCEKCMELKNKDHGKV